jgi:hypothetical protein
MTDDNPAPGLIVLPPLGASTAELAAHGCWRPHDRQRPAYVVDARLVNAQAQETGAWGVHPVTGRRVRRWPRVSPLGWT